MMISRRNRLLIAALLVVQLYAALIAPAAHSAPPVAKRIAVIYPVYREPYRTAMRDIVDGAEQEFPGSVNAFELDPKQTAAVLSKQLLGDKLNGVVLLGVPGLALSAAMDPALRRVVGAVLPAPNEIPAGVQAISLAPSPPLLFAKLRELAPKVQRIHVIHSAGKDDWLIERAQVAAIQQGYVLNATRTEGIKDGALAYRALVAGSGPEDAVWLLQGSAVLNESEVMKMIIGKAWERDIVVFSSQFSHVARGALFALYPDFVSMGVHLAKLADGSTPSQPGLQPLEQLSTAINIKTANHLGLALDARDSRFKTVFPSR